MLGDLTDWLTSAQPGQAIRINDQQQALQNQQLGQQAAQQRAMFDQQLALSNQQAAMYRSFDFEEADLKENNPAVKDAWEKYQIILKLSRKA